MVVVALSLAALGPVPVPVNVVRSLRAFRVLRLFGRFKGLTSIVVALAASVVPVLQALLILLIVSSICAAPPPPLPPSPSSSFEYLVDGNGRYRVK